MAEQAGYRRDQIGSLTRWYVLRVLQHPTDDKGELVAQYAEQRQPPQSRGQVLRRLLLARNYPARLVDGRVAELLAGEAPT